MMTPFDTALLRHMPVDLEAPTKAERQARKNHRIACPHLKLTIAALISGMLRRHYVSRPTKATRSDA
jgi:hypothetical protein